MKTILGAKSAARIMCVFAIGATIAMAQQPAGTVRSWGKNLNGELGNGLAGDSPVPQSVQNLTDVVAISSGGGAGVSGYSLAIRADGSVWGWGNNGLGQLGVPGVSFTRVPVPVPGLGSGSGVIAIATGGGHTLALKSDGSVLAWGRNGNGQLGNGGLVGVPATSGVPSPVVGLGSGSGVIAISAGFAHSLALKSDGSVLAWGLDGSGQLGGGFTRGDKTVPSAVSGLGSSSGVVAISAGGAFNLALKSDGSVAAWGRNFEGQLGSGASSQQVSSTPVAVSGLGSGAGIIAVAAGDAHGMALKSDGSVLSWGSNASGQLGNGDAAFANTAVPGQVSGLGSGSGVIAIAGGAKFSLILKADGTAWTWGSNQVGQLGNGGGAAQIKPVQVSNLNGGVAIDLNSQSEHALSIVQPVAALNSASLNFADQLVGSLSASQMITIQNQGQDPLVINSLTLSGAAASDFQVAAPPMPFTIAPGASVALSVAFSPTSEFARLATLLIADNGFDAPQFVSLSGNGLLQADIAVSLGANPTPVHNDKTLTYTIGVKNAGPTRAPSVVVSDALPAGTVLVSGKTTQGSCLTPAPGTTGTVTCNLGSFNNGAVATVTLVVTVRAPGGSAVVNTVSAIAGAPDPNLGNNSVTVATPVFGSKK